MCPDSEDYLSELWDKDPQHAKALQERMNEQAHPFKNLAGLFVTAVKNILTNAPRPDSDHEKAIAMQAIKPVKRQP